MSLLNCAFIVAILVLKETVNGAPPPEPLTGLAVDLKSATDALYTTDLFLDRIPDTDYLDEDFTEHQAKFDKFAEVLEKIAESNLEISFEQLVDIKLFYEFLMSFDKYRGESKTLGKIIDAVKTHAEKVLEGLDKSFVEGEFEKHLAAAREAIGSADPSKEAIESFFHYYYYTEHKQIKAGMASMFEAVEIFSYIGQHEVRRAFQHDHSGPFIPIDPHVNRIYVILFAMGLDMGFNSQELHNHISLDVKSVESLTKNKDLYYVDNQARRIYVKALGGATKYGKETTHLLLDTSLLAIGKISQIHAHTNSDKQIIVQHLVALAMVAIEYEHRTKELSNFGKKVAASAEVAKGLKLIKEVVGHADFHLDSKIALKAVEIKVLVESKPTDHTELNANIQALIKLLHSLPKEHGLGAITQIALYRLGLVSEEFVKHYSTVASYKDVASLAENMVDYFGSNLLSHMETLVRAVAPRRTIIRNLAALTIQRENALQQFYVILSSLEFKGIYLIGEETVCTRIVRVHKFAVDNISNWSQDVKNMQKSLETQENIKTIEQFTIDAVAAAAAPKE